MMENLNHLKKEIAVLLPLDSKCQLDEITRGRAEQREDLCYFLSIVINETQLTTSQREKNGCIYRMSV